MKPWLIGCLVALLAGSLALAGGCWWFFVREAPRLDGELRHPPRVALGETFELVVALSNPHADALALDSIDIAHAFLDGFQVVSVEPEPKDTDEIPFLDQRTWSFGLQVPPGGHAAVTFRLRPVKSGHHRGTLDVCNPTQDCLGLLPDVVVTERGEESEAADPGA